MPFIVYNLMDPERQNGKPDYVVVTDTLEEAQTSFDTAIEDLHYGEGFYIAEIVADRGDLTEEAIEAGFKNDWADYEGGVIQSVENYYSDEAGDEWESEN